MEGQIRLGCCIPGGSFMPQGVGAVGDSPYEQLAAGRRAVTDAGFDYAEAAVGAVMKLSEDELSRAEGEGLRIEYFNSFIPGQYKIIESRDGYDAALEYAKQAAERVARVGGRLIVFGSGAARKRPDGVGPDRAANIITRFCAEAASVLDGYGIVLALEPLNSGETNVINTLAEGAALVERVGAGNFRLLCDAFHMFRAGEGPDEIARYAEILCHVHVAEPPERLYPGKNGGLYLRRLAEALKAAGYTGGVTAECGFGSDIGTEFASARAFMSEIFC